MTLAAFVISFLSIIQPSPVDSVSLNYCYQQARENYPIARNIALQDKITDLNTDIANSGYFPQINVSGKATYQSEVTSFSTPGGGGPDPVSKDQYDASVNVTETIFDGGRVGIQKDLERAKGRKEKYSTKVDMHKIRAQVDQVYYGILLSQQQGKTIGLLLKNLRKQLKTISSKVENGVLLPSQQHILQAEIIKAKQDSAENHANIVAGYKVLSELTGQMITPNTKLTLPRVRADYRSMQPQRPEYKIFESTRETLEQQQKLAKARKWPRISAFGTASYGRPGLNFLNDDFHNYYIGGLKLKWNFWTFFNSGRKMEALKIQQQKVTNNQQAFTKQLQASLDRIKEHISALRDKMKRDNKIINLRKKIVDESSSQLKNGVITATEYVTQLTEANQARLSKYIHRVQMAQAKTNYVTTLGLSINQ